MYKKALINLTAITMAMSLAFAPAVTTHAAEPNAIEFNVENKESIEITDQNAVINQDVDSDEQGKAAVTIENGGNVEINGDVEGTIAGIKTENGSNVTVNGDINSSGYTSTEDLRAGEANESGRQFSFQGSGIITDGTGNIVVNGDVTGKTEGILINSQPGVQGGKVIVDGKLSSTSTDIKKQLLERLD